MNSVTASTIFDVPTMLRARYWHWMKSRWQILITPVLGVVVAADAIAMLLSSYPMKVTSIVLLLLAIHLIFRYWILGFRYSRSIRRNPQFGKLLRWTLSADGLLGHSDDGDMFLRWSGFYETATTPDGFLLYPQKELYYWIPKSGFSSADDVSHVQSWLREFTKNQVLA